VLLIYPMVANFVVVAVALPFVYVPMPIEDLGLVALMSVLGWIGGVVIIAAYKTAEAVIVAPMQYSQIIWAIIFGYFFFGETIDLQTAIGASIIIASGLYIVLREGRSGASAHRPVLTAKSRPDASTGPRPTLLARMARMRPDER